MCIALPFVFFGAIGCGGSSSETAMPLEPVPHDGPAPPVVSKPAAEENDEAEEETTTPPEQEEK